MSSGSLTAPLQQVRPSWHLEALVGAVAAALAAALVSPNWALAIGVGIVILTLSALENELFLLCMVFLVPVGSVLKADLPIRDVATSARLLFCAGFFLGRILSWRSVRDWLFGLRFNYLYFAYCGIAGLSVLSGGLTHYSGRALFRLASYLGFYLVILGWANTEKRIVKVLIVVLSSAPLVALFGFYQAAVGGYTSLFSYLYPPDEGFVPWSGRITSFVDYSNSLAGYLDLVLPVALACSVSSVRRGVRTVAHFALILGTAALVLTQGRAALVAYGGILIFSIFSFVKSWRRRMILLLIMTIAAAGLITWIAQYSEHLSQIEEPNAIGRLLFFEAAWIMFGSSPILGVGFGNYRELYGSIINLSWIPPEQFNAHNTYLQILAETGILGFTAFFFMVLYAVREARRQFHYPAHALDRVLGFAVLAAILGVLIHGSLDYLFEVSPQFGTQFWTLIALLMANHQLRVRNREQPFLQTQSH